MKFLITGVTGFVGPHLACSLLQQGHEVHGLVRCSNGREVVLLDTLENYEFDRMIFKYADLRDADRVYSVIKDGQYDGIFHLGAQSNPPTSFLDPIGTFATNVMGSMHIIEGITKYSPNTKLLMVSTSEVYGDGIFVRGDSLLTESSPIMPSNPYGASKASIDMHLQEMMRNKRIKAIVTRAFSHTGWGRGKNFSISGDAYQLASICHNEDRWDEDVEHVIRVGNLKTKRVVIDVTDVVRAYEDLMLCEESVGETFNICGDPETVKEMEFYTDELIKISGVVNVKKEIYAPYFRPIDIQTQMGSNDKIKSFIGWSPKIKIEQTLSILLEYWKYKLDSL